MSDDIQDTLTNQGYVQGIGGEVCIDSGPDGVANTTICGNGIHDDVENPNTTFPDTECDDADTSGGDGCSALCLVEIGWSCGGTPSACAPICGDGQIVGGEPCDDHNLSNTDACVTIGGVCAVATCGDGFRKTGGPGPDELCDDGNLVNGDGCDTNCTSTRLRQRRRHAGEACDDGNLVNGDGCDTNCTPTGCGNGVVTAGEELRRRQPQQRRRLPQHLHATTSAATASCSTGGEPCDDGNTDERRRLRHNCTHDGCGNGIVTAG